ncbi:uncharacterized protein LOC111253730 [Varroa destructor]|uniref:Uncharacterized protein n=1 Tax=Varroa destructor TaxID=109461 RepID=A0A7M7L2Y5_VARDE|nr:uncharacterized protein LOC111253730 [Varroa destructor]
MSPFSISVLMILTLGVEGDAAPVLRDNMEKIAALDQPVRPAELADSTLSLRHILAATGSDSEKGTVLSELQKLLTYPLSGIVKHIANQSVALRPDEDTYSYVRSDTANEFNQVEQGSIDDSLRLKNELSVLRDLRNNTNSRGRPRPVRSVNMVVLPPSELRRPAKIEEFDSPGDELREVEDTDDRQGIDESEGSDNNDEDDDDEESFSHFRDDPQETDGANELIGGDEPLAVYFRDLALDEKADTWKSGEPGFNGVHRGDQDGLAGSDDAALIQRHQESVRARSRRR